MALKRKFNPLKEQWQSLDIFAPDITENSNCVFTLEDFFPGLDIVEGHLVHPGAVSLEIPQYLNFEFLRLKDKAFEGLVPRNSEGSLLNLCQSYKEKELKQNGLQLQDANGHKYFTANLSVLSGAIAQMQNPLIQKMFDENKTGLQAALVAYAVNNNYPVLFACDTIAETDKALMAKVDRYIRQNSPEWNTPDPLPR